MGIFSRDVYLIVLVFACSVSISESATLSSVFPLRPAFEQEFHSSARKLLGRDLLQQEPGEDETEEVEPASGTGKDATTEVLAVEVSAAEAPDRATTCPLALAARALYRRQLLALAADVTVREAADVRQVPLLPGLTPADALALAAYTAFAPETPGEPPHLPIKPTLVGGSSCSAVRFDFDGFTPPPIPHRSFDRFIESRYLLVLPAHPRPVLTVVLAVGDGLDDVATGGGPGTGPEAAYASLRTLAHEAVRLQVGSRSVLV
jgi:hypothetical protein